MIQALEECVRQHWRDLSAAQEPVAFHFLKFGWSDYPDPAAPLVFIVFADDSARPVAMVKAARIAAGDAIVEREFAQLERVRERTPETLRHVIPVPLRSWHVNARACFLASAVPGVSEILSTWGPRAAARRAPAMRAALRWSRMLRHETASEPITLCEWLGANVAEIQSALQHRGWTHDELHRLEPRLTEACEATWPASFVHGDFFPGNLLYEGQVLSGVVDWAGSFRRAPVFVDVLTYELSFALHAVYEGRLPTATERDGVHALEPIAESRRELRSEGVDLEHGSLARLAMLVAESAALGPAWSTRDRAATRFGTLLRIECGLSPR